MNESTQRVLFRLSTSQNRLGIRRISSLLDKCPTNTSTDLLKSWMLSTGKLVYHNRAAPDRVVRMKMHKYFSSK